MNAAVATSLNPFLTLVRTGFHYLLSHRNFRFLVLFRAPQDRQNSRLLFSNKNGTHALESRFVRERNHIWADNVFLASHQVRYHSIVELEDG